MRGSEEAAIEIIADRDVPGRGALPSMRDETDKLLVELADLARVKKETAAERNLLAGQLAELADVQKRMAALVEERQKRQAEIEEAIAGERQRALALSRQVDNLKDLIGKLEQGLDGTGRGRSRLGAARRGFKTCRRDTSPSLSRRSSDLSRMAPAIAFVSAKGKLARP